MKTVVYVSGDLESFFLGSYHLRGVIGIVLVLFVLSVNSQWQAKDLSLMERISSVQNVQRTN